MFPVLHQIGSSSWSTVKLTHKLLFLLKHFRECIQCQVESLLSITFQLLGFVFSRLRRCCRSRVVKWTFPRRWCRMAKPSKTFYVPTHLNHPHFFKNKTQVLFSFRVQLSIPSAKSTANLQSVMDSGRLDQSRSHKLHIIKQQPVDALRANDCDDRFCMEITLVVFVWYSKASSLVNCVPGTVQSLFISLSILRAIFIAENILWLWFSLLLPIPSALDACALLTSVIQTMCSGCI